MLPQLLQLMLLLRGLLKPRLMLMLTTDTTDVVMDMLLMDMDMDTLPTTDTHLPMAMDADTDMDMAVKLHKTNKRNHSWIPNPFLSFLTKKGIGNPYTKLP